ncbi:hypothetical protein L3X37_01425 [Sabulilitoribacter arenilitoris]|uniref:Uncharacterized protein n=1 Tax=Wocania arenilitoris TaxID=2044858 RepID=A0AAE3JKC5_9FLAO|nr:hypothetical protein [Wocania arenilitoris]MCF7567024.1 hypothetical protein [Wocania arenilitoris]
MKENDDKYLDNFTKKVIKKAVLESPSIHFTSEIMSQVKAFNNSKVTVYKPLISKKAWILIAIGFISICVYYLILGTEIEKSGWLSTLDFSVLSNNKVSNTLSSFTMSKTLMYAVTFFGIMFCIQIPFLKNYFDKQLEM